MDHVEPHEDLDRSRTDPEAGLSLISAPTPEEVEPDDPAAVAIQAAIAGAVRRLLENEPDARNEQTEGVHHMRTSSRRLRSLLRELRGLVDEAWAEGLIEELCWLARVLGDVRDLDVLLIRVHQAAGDHDEAFGPLFVDLEERRKVARAALKAALDSERYRVLRDRLIEAASQPALTESATQPAGDLLPPRVAGVWKKLRKRARDLEPDSPEAEFHEVRKRAKRARYIAEALGPVVGSGVRRFATVAQGVQDVLGEHQDAVVMQTTIERVALGRPQDGPFNLAAGQLLERQRQAAEKARSTFFQTWKRMDRKKTRRWLKVSH